MEQDMPNSQYWADAYIQKRVDADTAIGRIRSGQRVFIGSGCGEPQVLVKKLVEKTNNFTGLEIVRLLGQETVSLAAIADKTQDTNLNIRSIYLGAAKSAGQVERGPGGSGNSRFTKRKWTAG